MILSSPLSSLIKHRALQWLEILQGVTLSVNTWNRQTELQGEDTQPQRGATRWRSPANTAQTSACCMVGWTVTSVRKENVSPTGQWFERKAGNPRQAPLQLQRDRSPARTAQARPRMGMWEQSQALRKNPSLVPRPRRCWDWLAARGCQGTRFDSERETTLCRTPKPKCSVKGKEGWFCSMTFLQTLPQGSLSANPGTGESRADK